MPDFDRHHAITSKPSRSCDLISMTSRMRSQPCPTGPRIHCLPLSRMSSPVLKGESVHATETLVQFAHTQYACDSEVRTITADIEKASKRSRFKQLLSAKDTSEKVTGCVKRLSQCVNSLLVRTALRNGQIVDADIVQIGITADSNRKTTVGR